MGSKGKMRVSIRLTGASSISIGVAIAGDRVGETERKTITSDRDHCTATGILMTDSEFRRRHGFAVGGGPLSRLDLDPLD